MLYFKAAVPNFLALLGTNDQFDGREFFHGGGVCVWGGGEAGSQGGTRGGFGMI